MNTEATTTTRKIVINWGGLMYDPEVAEETGVPGLGWAIDPYDDVTFLYDGEVVEPPDLSSPPSRDGVQGVFMMVPCFVRVEHAIGCFLAHLPAQWRAAEIVLPDDVDEMMGAIH